MFVHTYMINFYTLIKAYRSQWYLNIPKIQVLDLDMFCTDFNLSKSNIKSNLALGQVHVRTDMLRENPLLLSMEADRDVLYLLVTFVLFRNSHENPSVASSDKASEKNNFKQGLTCE